MIVIVVGLCILLTLSGVVSLAQDDQPQDGRYYETQAGKAYQEKDYSSFLTNDKLKEPTVLKIKL